MLWLLVIYKLELPKCEASSLKHKVGKEDFQGWCCSSHKPLLCWPKELARTSTKQGCIVQSSNPWRWWTRKKEYNTCVWLISKTLRELFICTNWRERNWYQLREKSCRESFSSSSYKGLWYQSKRKVVESLFHLLLIRVYDINQTQVLCSFFFVHHLERLLDCPIHPCLVEVLASSLGQQRRGLRLEQHHP